MKVEESMRTIVSAAVKIWEEQQQKEIVIPCHRHCDAYYILKEFGYGSNKGYKTLEQGFLDNEWNFVNRLEAREIAFAANQIDDSVQGRLFSEDLW